MTILRDVLAELWSMFLGDLRLSLSVLALIAVAAALVSATPLGAGLLLLAGCLGILAATTLRAARQKRGSR